MVRQSSLAEYITGLEPWRVAEERIRRFVEEYDARFVYVLFSGGKDSAAVLAAANNVVRDRLVVVYLHIVGQTHHDNLAVARAMDIPVVTIVARREMFTSMVRGIVEERGAPLMLHVIVRTFRYGLDFWQGIERWGMPVPSERGRIGIRWCCAELKEKWIKSLPRFGRYRHLISGVRASESPHRRKTSQLIRVCGASVTLLPLYDMSDHDVLSMLRYYGIYDIVKRQYDVWRQAPNCTLCPMMSIDKLKVAVSKLPTPFLQRVVTSLSKAMEKAGPVARYKIEQWLSVINEELSQRGDGHSV